MVVGQAIAGLIRQRTIAKKQTDIITPVLQAFPSVVSGIMENMDEIYAQIGQKALTKLDELYQNQIEVSREAIEHARRIVSDENIKMAGRAGRPGGHAADDPWPQAVPGGVRLKKSPPT